MIIIKYEEHKMNFEGMYFHNGWVDLTQIWNGMCPTSRESPMVKSCSGIIKVITNA